MRVCMVTEARERGGWRCRRGEVPGQPANPCSFKVLQHMGAIQQGGGLMLLLPILQDKQGGNGHVLGNHHLS